MKLGVSRNNMQIMASQQNSGSFTEFEIGLAERFHLPVSSAEDPELDWLLNGSRCAETIGTIRR